jgi:beta-lactamase regulating signal transducer with metallopeptidase domain
MLQYLLKFSISLAALLVFYMVVLRPLTFYTWNRFYLLCYSLCSFIIPVIDITPWVVKRGVDNSSLVSIIPPLGNYAVYANSNAQPIPAAHPLTGSQWLLILFCSGVLAMLFRFVMQYRSLRRIRRQSVLLNQDDDVQLFQTAARVSPFSFGNAIYFNKSLHSAEELHKIIQHEFIHVKQKHSVDMLVGELLCIINWFNPFAWLIRRAIRQNLEFIADNAVIENGLDKKEYQYLLLKAVGIPQYSIGNNFNFSNLKKRIMMMNKIKSGRLHLTKFLFVLPLLTVLLLAFRNKINDEAGKNVNIAGPVADAVTLQPIANAKSGKLRGDTLPMPPPPPPPAVSGPSTMVNKKGYIISTADNNGECIVLVKDKNHKIVKAVTLTEWNNSKNENENLYGKLPVIRPVPPAGPASPPLKISVDTKPVPAKASANSSKPIAPVSADKLQTAIGLFTGPLVVVDGKEQVEGFDVKSIPPATISSINVLKEKSALEKYGAKGKNGVIELTTTFPIYIVDGIERKDIGNNNAIPADKIKTINVLKDNAAIEKYGERGRNGVVEITTVAPGYLFDGKQADAVTAAGHKVGAFPPNVLIIVDGKEIDAAIKNSMDPNTIERVHVLKSSEAEAAYGDKGKNGVIIITTKKNHHPAGIKKPATKFTGKPETVQPAQNG